MKLTFVQRATYAEIIPLLRTNKIDLAFICSGTYALCNDEFGWELLAIPVIGLAHSLNLKVVAEGIETRQQATFLRLKDCHQGQGFLFSKPVSATQLEKIFHNKY